MHSSISITRLLTLLLLGGGGFVAGISQAQESPPLTGARLLSRIARQPREIRPTIFDLAEPVSKTQLAIVIDGTTSMKRELQELPHFLTDVADLFSRDVPESLQIAVVVYRDARSPSGPVTIVSDFTDNVQTLRDKLLVQKPETGEPFFPEALDQGLFTALDSLNWNKDDPQTSRRLLIIGDAPPFNDDHENRKHRDAELNRLISDRRVRVDSLLVNSGFPLTAGVVGTSRDSAMKAAPDAREFLTALAAKTGGKFLDLWDEARIDPLQEPTVLLSGLAPLPPPDPIPLPGAEVWKAFLARHLASVRAERPALQAFNRLDEMRPLSQSPSSLLPRTWPAPELKLVILDLESAIEEEPDNPVLHLLLAQFHSLLATADGYDDHAPAILRHVQAARAQAGESLPVPLRDEIEAWYSLHLLGDRAAALKSLTGLNSEAAEKDNPGCRLRSAWMSLALELGFWPATAVGPAGAVDQSNCRKLIHQILKSWPDSIEAQALRSCTDSSYENLTEISRSLFNTPRAQ